MQYWCLGKIARALNPHEKAVKGSKVLLLGIAYKSESTIRASRRL